MLLLVLTLSEIVWLVMLTPGGAPPPPPPPAPPSPNDEETSDLIGLLMRERMVNG